MEVILAARSAPSSVLATSSVLANSDALVATSDGLQPSSDGLMDAERKEPRRIPLRCKRILSTAGTVSEHHHLHRRKITPP